MLSVPIFRGYGTALSVLYKGDPMETEYITTAGSSQDEFVERKSRFIGHSCHVETEEEAAAFIREIKQKYWDATHNVYAYQLREGQIRRYSDDGEPQGTAGVPVLDVILKEGITDVCVVVTRYFSGTLLGAGGLVRAYSHGASLALAAATKKYISVCCLYGLEFDYSLYGKISYILPNYNIQIMRSDFGASVSLQLLVKKERAGQFLAELTDLTNGAVSPVLLEEKFADMK